MWYILIGFITMGIIVGVVFTLFLINFDGKWKIVLESIVGIGSSSYGVGALCDFYEITEQTPKLIATIGYDIGFLGSTICFLIVLCRIIKNKDDTDSIKISDILLGQKLYIEKYYQKRMDEIDQKLGIPKLIEREEKVSQRENAVKYSEQFIEEQKKELEILGNSKLRINIPYKHKVILTKDFLESMPEYIYGLAKFVGDLKDETEIQKDIINNKAELTGYLYLIATYVIKDIFETSSETIRVHFRYYDKQEDKYIKLVAISGKSIVTRGMTPIPYNNSLIAKSFECKCALIKSVNSEFDYQANNYTVWEDYMTYSFYSITENNRPIITFGISVKNKAIHKNKFYFLNYFKIEQYLEDAIISINEKCKIRDIIYGKEEN